MGLLAYRYLAIRLPAGEASDFTPVYVGAAAVLRGHDPWVAVAQAPIWLHLLMYPMPAVLTVAPLTAVELHAAAALFLALPSAWFAYVLTRDAWWPLLLFASGGFWWSIQAVQWTPLLMAAALSGPAAGLAIAVKPTYGIALLAMQTRWRTMIGGCLVALGIIAASLLVRPSWPFDYLQAVRATPIRHEYVAPALTWLGAPLWLAALRWRDWRARLVLGMGLSPLNALAYSHLPLLLVARSRAQLLALSVASWAGYALSWRAIARVSHGSTWAALTPHLEPIAIVAYYVPALAVVLFTRCE